MQCLASSPLNQTSVSSSLIPSLAPAPPVRTTEPNRTSSDPPKPHPTEKSKADILREYRIRIGKVFDSYDGIAMSHCGTGKPHLPEQILLRDALYLLQGISGKYVKFSEEGRKEEGSKIVFVSDQVDPLFKSAFITSPVTTPN